MIKFPAAVLRPVKTYLEERRKDTEKKLADLEKEDPFSDTDRTNDNAASDTEVKEQMGHARIEAVKNELNRDLIRVKKTLTKIGVGKYGVCEKCGKMIDTERLSALPTAELCIECARKEETHK
ncbi:TraR/DksA C4-type zinc finger protein [Candidatus Microgenomates bacterium]|nr:TraR/DksA C4-type zinc finger protein [Candidatus Microgenomates bacterium]